MYIGIFKNELLVLKKRHTDLLAVDLLLFGILYTEVTYQILSLVLFGYSIVMLFLAMMHKKNGAVPMFIGFIILLMTVINDILYMNMFQPSLTLLDDF